MALCNEHTGAEQRIDWGAVIAALATQPEQRSRSSLENKHRKLSSDAGAGKPRPWTTEEEERLMALCEQHSDAEQSIDWDRVSQTHTMHPHTAAVISCCTDADMLPLRVG